MTEWKPRNDECSEQLICIDFIWKTKARNEHVRRTEICNHFVGGSCDMLQGQSCLISKGNIARGKR